MPCTIEAATFLDQWRTLAGSMPQQLALALPVTADVEVALAALRCTTVAVRLVAGTAMQAIYAACQPAAGPEVLFELKYTPHTAPLQLTVKSERAGMAALVADALSKRFAA